MDNLESVFKSILSGKNEEIGQAIAYYEKAIETRPDDVLMALINSFVYSVESKVNDYYINVILDIIHPIIFFIHIYH